MNVPPHLTLEHAHSKERIFESIEINPNSTYLLSEPSVQSSLVFKCKKLPGVQMVVFQMAWLFPVGKKQHEMHGKTHWRLLTVGIIVRSLGEG